MLKDFKMDELRIICAIAETASVSRAAQRLNMPQSNVSRTLTSVERKVGLAIFLRAARELVRTEFGEQFIHASRAVLEQHEQLINLADRYKNTLQGVVTLGAPIGIHQFLGRYILPALRKPCQSYRSIWSPATPASGNRNTAPSSIATAIC